MAPEAGWGDDPVRAGRPRSRDGNRRPRRNQPPRPRRPLGQGRRSCFHSIEPRCIFANPGWEAGTQRQADTRFVRAIRRLTIGVRIGQ